MMMVCNDYLFLNKSDVFQELLDGVTNKVVGIKGPTLRFFDACVIDVGYCLDAPNYLPTGGYSDLLYDYPPLGYST